MMLRQGLDVLFAECESVLGYVTSSSLFPGDGYFCSFDNRSIWDVYSSNYHVDDMLWLFCFIFPVRLSFPKLVFGSVTEELSEVPFVY